MIAVPESVMVRTISQALGQYGVTLSREIADEFTILDYLEQAWDAEPEVPYTIYDWIKETKQNYPEYFL